MSDPDKNAFNDTFDNFDFDEFEDIELPIRADTTTVPVRDRDNEPAFFADENQAALDEMYENAKANKVKYHLADVDDYLPTRLFSAGFELSKNCDGDGNCLLYALSDQLR